MKGAADRGQQAAPPTLPNSDFLMSYRRRFQKGVSPSPIPPPRPLPPTSEQDSTDFTGGVEWMVHTR